MNFETRYRIVTDRFAGYEVQSRPWWWPFWDMVSANTSCTVEEAEFWLRSYLEKQGRANHQFVKKVEP